MSSSDSIGHKIIDSNLTLSDTLLKKESEYEDFFIYHIHEIAEIVGWPEIDRIEKQFRITLKKGAIVCDIMLWHTDGTGTCIEIKMGNNNRNDDLMGIGQLLFYGKIMKESLSKLPRLVLVSPEIKTETFSVIKEFNLPLSLMRFNEGKCIYLSNGH